MDNLDTALRCRWVCDDVIAAVPALSNLAALNHALIQHIELGSFLRGSTRQFVKRHRATKLEALL